MHWYVRFRRSIAVVVVAIVAAGAGAVTVPVPANADNSLNCHGPVGSIRNKFGDTFQIYNCSVYRRVPVSWILSYFIPIGYVESGGTGVICQHHTETTFGQGNGVWLYSSVLTFNGDIGWGWMSVLGAGGTEYAGVHGVPFCSDVPFFDGWGHGSPA